MKLSAEQIAALWVKSGGLPSKTREAVATALCESGGDTKAVSSMGARGLWQFMPGTLASDHCAYNPDCATRAAVRLSKRGRDFSAWDCNPDSRARSGYSTGDAHYESILANLKTPLGEIGLPGPNLDFTNPLGPLNPIHLPGVSDLSSSLDSIKAIAAFFKGFGELVLTPEGWVRTGKLVGGSILVLWGLKVTINAATGIDPVRTATKSATKAAEAAAVVATVK